MERVAVNGAELEFEVHGSGEPVLLIHGSAIADFFVPLLAEPALAGRYRLIHHHRRGYAGSSRADGPVSIAEQAADARAVLRQVGAERAHVVGHSSGGVIALQLALDAPDTVQSLALLEPGLLHQVPGGEALSEALGPVLATYQAGDRAAAIDALERAVVGPDYRAVLDRVLPAGWFEQAVADIDTTFQVDLPALGDWEFNRELAGRITQPVLSVLGAESAPVFVEIHELLREWLPQMEPFVLPGATHGLQTQNPRGIAEALAGFFARHPLPVLV